MGRVLVTGGILLLLFVAYQLWGTGILQARAQNDLEQQFQEAVQAERARRPSTSTTAPGAPTTLAAATTTPPPAIPPQGDAVARIGIPKIGVDQYVVEGVDVDDLRKGPGHYPARHFPATRATRDRRPPHDLRRAVRRPRPARTWRRDHGPDRAGRLHVQVVGGPVRREPEPVKCSRPCPTRRARHQPRHAHADDVQPEVLGCRTSDREGGTGAAARRAAAAAAPEEVVNATRSRSAASTATSSSRSPRVLWGIIAALVGLAWWFLFHRYPRWYVWIVGAVPFLVVAVRVLHVPRAAAAVELLTARRSGPARYGIDVVFMVGTIVLAVLVVVLTKGSFERLGRSGSVLWLLFVALIQIVLEVVDFPEDRIDDVGFAILLLTYVADPRVLLASTARSRA